MEYQSSYEVKEYLHRFDQILCEMSNAMLSFNTTSNITINFLACMIVHHKAAIDMCENLLTYTNSKPLYKMANEMTKLQTNEISHMKNMLRTTKTCSNLEGQVTSYENCYLTIVKNMVEKMKNSLRIQNINVDFISEMIPHHEGAIQMCQNLLQYPVEQNLKIMVNTMMKEQTEEIKKLKQMQAELYR